MSGPNDQVRIVNSGVWIYLTQANYGKHRYLSNTDTHKNAPKDRVRTSTNISVNHISNASSN